MRGLGPLGDNPRHLRRGCHFCTLMSQGTTRYTGEADSPYFCLQSTLIVRIRRRYYDGPPDGSEPSLVNVEPESSLPLRNRPRARGDSYKQARSLLHFPAEHIEPRTVEVRVSEPARNEIGP
jgi:hypothetical protein